MPRKVILNVHMAEALIQRGFRIVSVKPSTKLQGRAAFIFEDSPGFMHALIELSRKK